MLIIMSDVNFNFKIKFKEILTHKFVIIDMLNTNNGNQILFYNISNNDT